MADDENPTPAPPKSLRWGETPWDAMSRDELLREVQRMYRAAEAAALVLSSVARDTPSAYWSPGGTGGRALALCRQVRDQVVSDYGSDVLYGAFYRYADDLLFPGRGFGWCVCDVCGQMVADGSGDVHAKAGTPCVFCKDPAVVVRPIEWRDLAPRPSADSP